MGRRKDQQEEAERRRLLKAAHTNLYSQIEELLFRHDPIGINFIDNTDEYDPEVGTVLPRLRDCQKVDDVVDVLFEEFKHWFGAGTAGPRSRYVPIAKELWVVWQAFKEKSG